MLVSRKDSNAGESKRHHRPTATEAEQAAARREAIERTMGMYAHLAPGRSMVDELIADRRAEARAEDLEEEERRHNGND